MKNRNDEPIGWDRSRYDAASGTWKHEYFVPKVAKRPTPDAPGELFGLFMFFGLPIIVVVAAILIHDYVEPKALPECPPFDECIGLPGTNHPDCNCWDSK